MEYFRTEDGQIQADLAFRLGAVLKQYHTQVVGPNKFEVSLCLSILQTLLTNCVELLNGLSSADKKNNPLRQFPIDSDKWGFDERNIVLNTFHQPEIDAEIVVRHIRNALSHPTRIEAKSNEKTTGYTTVRNSGAIERIKFIASPDLNPKGKPKIYSFDKTDEIKKQGCLPSDVLIEPAEPGKFKFTQNGKRFLRIFEIDLSPDNLLTLTYSLSNYLSQPLIKKNWDGVTFDIEKLVA